jgi:hypothetical protein
VIGDSEASPQELENQLLQTLEDAKVLLDLASNHLREVQRDLKSGTIPSPNGRYAYQQALRAEMLALKHYRLVVDTLSVLVLDGKIPD